jgi:predicted RNA-binding protein with PUA-like domain
MTSCLMMAPSGGRHGRMEGARHMNYWLLKTEPEAYSYEDLARDGETVWDGVTNNLALKFLRQMKKGDQALIYHTGGEKSVVGVADITRDPYPDPAAGDEKLVVVDVRPARKLPRPVPLSEIKADARFADFELVRNSRLSVMPVSPARWKLLLSMAGK